MTPEDKAEIRTMLVEQVSAFRQELRQEIAASNQEFRQELHKEISVLRDEIAAAIARTIEATRDMQTEILRGLERFAVGNFARMHRLETSDTDLNTRINSLEERVLALELRHPPLH